MDSRETDEVIIEGRIFTVETSKKYESNLQKALDFSLKNWGATTMVKFYLEVSREIDVLAYFPYTNAQNRFLENEQYREIILPHFPYVITYRIKAQKVKVINIIHTSRNPNIRKGTR